MASKYNEEDITMSEDEIKKKADELAKQLYNENKTIIDEITDDSKEVLNEEAENAIDTPKKSHKSSIFWSIFGVAFLALILLLIISNILDLGNRIKEATNQPYLEITYYVIIGILLILLIIIPFIQILFLPSYSSLFKFETHGKKEKIVANSKKISFLIKRHEEDWHIDSLSIKTQEKYYANKKILKESDDMNEIKKAYHTIYRNFIKKDITNIITNYSNKVFLATAVVQSGKIDSLMMLSTYMKMSKDILKYCGYRISWIRFCKLLFHVLTMLFAATKLSQIDFTALFPKMMMNSLNKIPGAKVVVNSLSDGVSNALIFYKTGIMLQEYLLSDNQNLIHQWGVSIKETAQYMLVGLVGEILKKIAEFASLALKKTVEGIQNFFLTIQKQITFKKPVNSEKKRLDIAIQP